MTDIPQAPCPTCSGPMSRETVGMVCQTCGRDYGSPGTIPDAWRDSDGRIYVNRRKHAGLPFVFDADSDAEPLWLVPSPPADAADVRRQTAEYTLREAADDLHVHRFDHQHGDVGGPDSFYRGVQWARNRLRELRARLAREVGGDRG